MLPIDQPLNLQPFAKQSLWLKIDLRPSLLGSLRAFLYKAPQVKITIVDINGAKRSFLMPLPMGRTGFIINPLVDDPVSYMEFAASRSKRLVKSVSLEIAPEHRKYFANDATYEVSAMIPPTSGEKYFSSAFERMFYMFKSYPITYDAQNPFSSGVIQGRDVAVMHAPSVMTFNVPKGATKVSGRFGFLPGAYTNGGRTNGAEFVVYWSDGGDRIELFHKFCDPLNVDQDHGLQYFEASLKGLSGGRLYLQVKPGPYNDYAWDWTGWTDIEIE